MCLCVLVFLSFAFPKDVPTYREVQWNANVSATPLLASTASSFSSSSSLRASSSRSFALGARNESSSLYDEDDEDVLVRSREVREGSATGEDGNFSAKTPNRPVKKKNALTLVKRDSQLSQSTLFGATSSSYRDAIQVWDRALADRSSLRDEGLGQHPPAKTREEEEGA
jgi:hypothetical protein